MCAKLRTLPTLISVQAADSVFRSDINCVKTQNPLEIKSDNMKTGRLTWLKNKADHQYTVTATKNVGDDWQTVSYTVTPGKNGDFRFSLQGQWAKDKEKRSWVLIDSVKVNGELVPNGDFKTTWKSKEGKRFPHNFWLNAKAQYVPDGGKDGSAAILVNHDNGSGYTIKNAEAGKAYTIAVTLKAAEAPAE